MSIYLLTSASISFELIGNLSFTCILVLFGYSAELMMVKITVFQLVLFAQI